MSRKINHEFNQSLHHRASEAATGSIKQEKNRTSPNITTPKGTALGEKRRKIYRERERERERERGEKGIHTP